MIQQQQPSSSSLLLNWLFLGAEAWLLVSRGYQCYLTQRLLGGPTHRAKPLPDDAVIVCLYHCCCAVGWGWDAMGVDEQQSWNVRAATHILAWCGGTEAEGNALNTNFAVINQRKATESWC